MTSAIILSLNIAFFVMIAVIANRRSKNGQTELGSIRVTKKLMEDKVANFRAELALLKEENVKKTKQLEELRDNAKRRLRKEGRKQDIEETDGMLDNQEQTPSFDLALKTVQQQAEEAHQVELGKLKAHYQERIAKLENQVGQRKQNVEKSKKNLENAIVVPVEDLPEEVALEMGRMQRKAEHAEKLLAATRGKLQMSQERFSEMQKRYFGVCRELALASGQALGTSDEEVRVQAEDLVALAEKEAVVT
ncbi:MAG: hypothetical protein I8H75_05160 [Myxococcaceae bacterium]|nr:hypothetical protein [Myxococcaceae bacterium]MBH2006712.1 hypothetical protein [Myxococcaceae bacterium]